MKIASHYYSTVSYRALVAGMHITADQQYRDILKTIDTLAARAALSNRIKGR